MRINVKLFIKIAAIFLIISCDKNKDVHYSSPFEEIKARVGIINQIKAKVGLTGDNPVMDFEEDNHDFGQIKAGDIVTHNFKFTNTGKTPLIIYNTYPTCGCTTPKYPKEPIAPGKKGVIEVKFDSKGFEGKKNKSVVIETNTIGGMETIKFEATVNKK